MKTSFLAALGLATSTIASPIVGNLLSPGDLDLSRVGAGSRVFNFDYQVTVRAVPRQVVNSDSQPTGGLANSEGIYRLGFIAATNQICYNITHTNFRGQYSSPARTATHLHEAARGSAGPPRIAFPNPEGNRASRNRAGCLRGPFTTGLDDDNGNDTGRGFHVRRIINNPSAFFVDAHSSQAIDGAFRGQLPAN